MTALGLAVVAFVVVLGGWLHYLSLIPKERVPKDPAADKAAMGLGALLAVAACGVALASAEGPVVATWVIAGLSVGFVGFFLWLLKIAKLPTAPATVSVGDVLPAFTAFDTAGAPYDAAALKGRRALVKLFRGSW